MDRAYRAWLKQQRCVVCGRGPCDVAHVGERGLGMKCPDDQALPLCPGHHRRDGWPDAHHRLGRKFWEWHGLDRDALIKEHRGRFLASRR